MSQKLMRCGFQVSYEGSDCAVMELDSRQWRIVGKHLSSGLAGGRPRLNDRKIFDGLLYISAHWEQLASCSSAIRLASNIASKISTMDPRRLFRKSVESVDGINGQERKVRLVGELH